MPVIDSTYKPPFYFRNGFVATVYSGLFRKIVLPQKRERLELEDGDFMDLDWSHSKAPTTKAVILLSGLEGHGQRPYMTGAARLFNSHGYDAVCVNFRGTSGEPNRKFYAYHSGATGDVQVIVQHLLEKGYNELFLKGFSLGGNLVLKYLGERINIPQQVKAGVAVSVPCSLAGAAQQLHRWHNKPFHDRFKRALKKNLLHKHRSFPGQLSKQQFDAIKTLNDFDEIYTSRAHGFQNAQDYYQQSSCLQFLPQIKTPALVLNALNDSFLDAACYPVKAAKNNPKVYLEMPKYGGHVGFIRRNKPYYNEERALQFFHQYGL